MGPKLKPPEDLLWIVTKVVLHGLLFPMLRAQDRLGCAKQIFLSQRENFKPFWLLHLVLTKKLGLFFVRRLENGELAETLA